MHSSSSSYLLPQSDLLEKFNAAFYQTQEKNRITLIEDEEEILESFDESYFTNIDAYEETDFDYTDLSESLDHVFGGSEPTTTTTTTTISDFSNFYVPPPLPPISTITRSNNTDFANFLRTMPCDSLDLFTEVCIIITIIVVVVEKIQMQLFVCTE